MPALLVVSCQLLFVGCYLLVVSCELLVIINNNQFPMPSLADAQCPISNSHILDLLNINKYF
ncbi:MAG: hypothetical protein EAZ88_16550 [Oscillatoriales cyanobacterium]|nr:MAG: hypothetical protein EAZ88_16550 [Oscillatoriales cyanobacterium]TAE65864.1 MAG: hypothetical protein EAZ86_22835 [Oscillatoriales cyanobacterium]